MWLFGGDVEGSAVRPTIQFSTDDGDTLQPTDAIGMGYPQSFAYSGTRWLAAGRTNNTVNGTGIMLSSTNALSWTPHVSNLDFDDRGRPRLLRFVNGKFFVAYDLGLFVSEDNGEVWTQVPGVNSFAKSITTGQRGPRAFAISPFGEYWGVGGSSSIGDPVAIFLYSTDNGKTWKNNSVNVAFSQPNSQATDQLVRSMAYGAGQFVMVGAPEVSGAQIGVIPILNTVLTAVDPSSFQGLGAQFFLETRVGSWNRNGRRVIYSERESIFVLCGAKGNQGGTSLAWSVNPKANDLAAGSDGTAGIVGMFDDLCLDVASRDDNFANTSGVASGSASLSIVVQQSDRLVVPAAFSVAKGDLKSGGQLTFLSEASFNGSGSVYFSGVTRVVQGAAVRTGVAAVTFPATSVLEVAVARPVNGSASVVVPLFNYSFYVGSFAAVRSVNTFDSCTTLGTPVVTYGSSSASALVTVDSSACASATTNQPLSTGAIVGIAVGAAAAGVVVVIASVFATKAALAHRDARANASLRLQDMSQLRAAQASI